MRCGVGLLGMLVMLLLVGCGEQIPTYSVSGVVVDAEGNPVEGVWVYVTDDQFKREIDLVGPAGADGRWEVRGVVGPVRILPLKGDWVFAEHRVSEATHNLESEGVPQPFAIVNADLEVQVDNQTELVPIVLESDGRRGTADLRPFAEEDAVNGGTIEVSIPVRLEVTGPPILLAALADPVQFLAPGVNPFAAIAELSLFDPNYDGVRVRLLRAILPDSVIPITGVATDLLGNRYDVVTELVLQ